MNFEELRQTLDQLRAEQRTVNIFFRDDDVDADEETLWHLLKPFLFRGVPINLEIIPGKLTNSTAKLLRQHQRSYSKLIELNQHGWQHTNHEIEGRKCEFGASRNFAQQLNDISYGKAKLDEIFGDQWHPVFTPPWNRCTKDTLHALDELGFKVFSKDHSHQPITNYSFTEISITLDLYRWKPQAAMKPPATIVNELRLQIFELDTVGILLHHKVMDAAAFSFLDALLDELHRHPVVRFHTFQSLVSNVCAIAKGVS